MKDIYLIYLDWLRASLWSKIPSTPLPQGEELSQLLALCRRQATGAMVYPLILERSSQLSDAVKQQLQMHCLQTMREQVRLQHTLLSVWRVLTQAGIQPVLFKGISLAALYSTPSMRQWGDIDLYVGRAHFHAACQAIREAFPGAQEEGEESDRVKHYEFYVEDVMVEIHRRAVSLTHPCDIRRFRRIEQRQLDDLTQADTIRVENEEIRIPGADFYTLFVFMHSWEHTLWTGSNAKHFSDLTLVLHHYAQLINRKQLISNLRRLRLLDVWKMYMYILVNYFGLPADEAPCYTPRCSRRAERFLIDTLEGKMHDNRTTDKPVPTSVLARKIYTMRHRLRKPRRIAKYSPAFALHMTPPILLHGLKRLLVWR